MTTKDLERLLAEGKIRGYTETANAKSGEIPSSGRPSKYGAKKQEFEGMVFDSAKELKRYLQLRYRLMEGEITDLLRQVEFELNAGGTHALKYIADFVYKDVASGQVIVEDVKGYRTREYKKKRRLMQQVHGITIKET